MRKMVLAGVAAALVCGTATSGAWAQDYPTNPVRIIVPFAPGGSSDVLLRFLAPALTEELGQNVIIENMPGAGGRTATQHIIIADPDGYTIGFGNVGTLVGAMALFSDIAYDTRTDLRPLGLLADGPLVLAVSNASGIETMEEFIAFAKENGEAVNFGTGGYGAASDLALQYFLYVTGLQATDVPYNGIGPALNDLTAGAMDAVIDQTATLISYEQGGMAKALAVTGSERSAQMPDVPTFTEVGVPEYDMTIWNALVAPAGTPDEVVDRWAEAIDAVLQRDDIVERFGKLGLPIPQESDRGPQALGERIEREIGRWEEVIAASGGPQQ